MADTITIVLEYLRRHHFTQAEAALRLELLARQKTNSLFHYAARSDLDLSLSLLAASSEKEVRTCHEEVLLDIGDTAFAAEISHSRSDHPVYEDTVTVNFPDCVCNGIPLQQLLPENPVAVGLQTEELKPFSENSFYGVAHTSQINTTPEKERCKTLACKQVEDASLNSTNNCIAENKFTSEPISGKDLLKIEDMELQVKEQGFYERRRETQNLKTPNGNNITGSFPSKITPQINEEKKLFETWQNFSFLLGCGLQQEMAQPCSQKVKKSNNVKVVEFQDLCAGKAGHSNEVFGEAICRTAVETKRWWELDGLSLNEAMNESFQSDTGASHLEKATTVHESGKLSGDLCGAFIESEKEQSRNNYSNCSVEVLPVKSTYSYFHSCPFNNSSLGRSPQHEREQMDLGHNLQGTKKYGAVMGISCSDFLEGLKMPWEVNFSDFMGGLGGSENSTELNTQRKQKELSITFHAGLGLMDKSFDSSKEMSGTFNLQSSSDVGSLQASSSTSKPYSESGSYPAIPLGQDRHSSGRKCPSTSSGHSVSQIIVEDTPELLSGFNTLGDGLNDSVAGYPQEYWDTDGYENDDDPGYHRQPIEDEAWFLAHEIDYPSDDDKANFFFEGINNQCKVNLEKLEEDGRLLVEEESYFSGEQIYRSDQPDLLGLNHIETINYDGHLMDAEELKLMRAEPMWQGFVAGTNQLGQDLIMSHEEDSLEVDDYRQSLTRYSGDLSYYGSELKESLFGVSDEVDIENVQDLGLEHMDGPIRLVADNNAHCKNHLEQETTKNNSRYLHTHETFHGWEHSNYVSDKKIIESSSYGLSNYRDLYVHGHIEEKEDVGGFGVGGFSFPSNSSTGEMVGPNGDSEKSGSSADDACLYGNLLPGPDNTLTSWKQESNESSPVLSSRDETLLNLASSKHSSISPQSIDVNLQWRPRTENDEGASANSREGEGRTAVNDDETTVLQEHVRPINIEEDDYEIFNLRIIHRRNRTGFEEDKNFPVLINSVIAGRFHVTEILGSAAFSKAIQAHDLHTGQDVCMKIIKNNKDFFDQSLDEIKLLKYINSHDPADKHHLLRLYDYFYYHEHLFIVCELLRANLYEFQKFNRESGGEPYFTMLRIQSITRQCLEALAFIHGLGLIHCDLKPENILVKSYSRCEVKVIDLGSSCFQTDHLCPYVQSRSYRSPEVILGHPYNQKIDIWSLGCILAELCSGNVLFQNDSLVTLLARIIGIIGPIDPEMLSKGHVVHKYFTKNHMLYERNMDTNQLEYLLPKKTSLRHRLPMGDQGFVDFVSYLLQISPENRPSATEALKHPWLSYPYSSISS